MISPEYFIFTLFSFSTKLLVSSIFGLVFCVVWVLGFFSWVLFWVCFGFVFLFVGLIFFFFI